MFGHKRIRVADIINFGSDGDKIHEVLFQQLLDDISALNIYKDTESDKQNENGIVLLPAIALFFGRRSIKAFLQHFRLQQYKK